LECRLGGWRRGGTGGGAEGKQGRGGGRGGGGRVNSRGGRGSVNKLSLSAEKKKKCIDRPQK